VAALAAGLATGNSWRERLVEAAAVSAAAVHAPLAGSFDHDAYQRYRAAVVIENLDASPMTEGTDTRHAAHTDR
jgi:tagatose 6-phosphate kinase